MDSTDFQDMEWAILILATKFIYSLAVNTLQEESQWELGHHVVQASQAQAMAQISIQQRFLQQQELKLEMQH
jgi:uncharacterized membrane protein affecting hemolysin expression